MLLQTQTIRLSDFFALEKFDLYPISILNNSWYSLPVYNVKHAYCLCVHLSSVALWRIRINVCSVLQDNVYLIYRYTCIDIVFLLLIARWIHYFAKDSSVVRIRSLLRRQRYTARVAAGINFIGCHQDSRPIVRQRSAQLPMALAVQPNSSTFIRFGRRLLPCVRWMGSVSVRL